jgi:hypothetical protein
VLLPKPVIHHAPNPASACAARRATLTEDEVPSCRRNAAEIALAEQELRVEISCYFEKIRPMERVMNRTPAAFAAVVKRCGCELQEIRVGLKKQIC